MDHMETLRMILSDAIKTSIEAEKKIIVQRRIIIVLIVAIVLLICGYFV